MEVKVPPLVLLLAVALAGCIQSAPGDDTTAVHSEPGPLVETEDGARLDAEVAGGWILVFLPVTQTGGVAVDYVLDHDVPSGGLLVMPSVMSTWRVDGASLSGTSMEWIDPSSADSIDGLHATSAANGFLVVGVASPGSWSVHLDLKTNATLGESIVWRGNDTRMEHAEGLTDETGGRVIRFQTEIETEGWTHFHVEGEQATSTGAYRTDVRFPNGFRYNAPGYQMLDGSSGAHGYFGTLADVPGTFQADLERLDASTRLDAWFLHMSDGGPRPTFLDAGGYLENQI